MGKYIWLIVVATVLSLMIQQATIRSTQLDTDKRQSERQSNVIARQIARSGYNVVLAEAKNRFRTGTDVSQIAASMDTLTAEYEGGEFKAWITQVSPSSYRATSVGTYNNQTHRIRIPHEKNIVPKPPTVHKRSELQVEFIESMAGYCSAVYLQRFVPSGKSNNGNGNNCDGVDSSNPGNGPKHDHDTDPSVDDECRGGGNGSYRALDPELVFAPGNNRNGSQTTFEKTIEPGTRLNFILAVDKDYTCERKGDTSIEIDDRFYEYTRPSFVENVNDLSQLHEAPFAMVQQRPDQPGTWRVAFEDKVFNEQELWDIKEHGYYGTGWGLDDLGFWDLENYGNRPDFSDQVIEVKIVTVEETGEDGGEDDNGGNNHRNRGR